jgi:ferredoxin-NADP reductase
MLRYVADKRQPWDIVLLYGNSTVDEIVFHEELDRISKLGFGLRIVHVLSDPPSGWSGKKGLINRDIVTETIPDYRERTYYTSGPPKMVVSLEELLTALNVPPHQLQRDSFTGYD